MGIRYSSILILGLILLSCSCKSSSPDRRSQRVESPPGAQAVLDDAANFAEQVLGERLRVHYTEAAGATHPGWYQSRGGWF